MSSEIGHVAQTEREERHLERSISHARRLNDNAMNVVGRLSEIKGRLVGYDSQKEPSIAEGSGVAPVQSECHELQDQLDSLEKRFGEMNKLLSSIERV